MNQTEDRKINFGASQAKSVEQIYMTPDVVAQRARTLGTLAVKRGEKILDIGVGPGLLLHDIASLTGTDGAVLGIDISPDMVAMATARVAPFGHARCDVGCATELAFDDGSLDAVVSTQVLEYIEDTDLALREMVRVLKSGGRCVIVDTDWNSVVMNTQDPRRLERLMRVWDRHLAHPFLPPKLPSALAQAGLNLTQVEVIPMVQIGWQPHGYIGYMLPAIVNFIQNNCDGTDVCAKDVEAFIDEQEALKEAGAFFFSVNRYQFHAVK